MTKEAHVSQSGGPGPLWTESANPAVQKMPTTDQHVMLCPRKSAAHPTSSSRCHHTKAQACHEYHLLQMRAKCPTWRRLFNGYEHIAINNGPEKLHLAGQNIAIREVDQKPASNNPNSDSSYPGPVGNPLASRNWLSAEGGHLRNSDTDRVPSWPMPRI